MDYDPNKLAVMDGFPQIFGTKNYHLMYDGEWQCIIAESNHKYRVVNRKAHGKLRKLTDKELIEAFKAERLIDEI